MTPGELAEFLGSLPVRIDRATGTVGFVEVEPYEDARGRPSSSIELRGRGERGLGEGLCWTPADQQALVDAVVGRLDRRAGTVTELAGPLRGYARAAAEGALIDLALRQAGLTLAAITGTSVALVEFAVSFDACADPADRAERILARNPGARFKVDVSPSWLPGQAQRLHELDVVAVLDFKLQGDAEQATQLRSLFPEALFEDSPIDHGPTAVDGAVREAADVQRHPVGAVNIKAARMGGFLEALRGLEICRLQERRAYFGGQFEVGVARQQARQLAGLFTAVSPNDLAPIVSPEHAPRGPSPLMVRLDAPGFGSLPPNASADT